MKNEKKPFINNKIFIAAVLAALALLLYILHLFLLHHQIQNIFAVPAYYTTTAKCSIGLSLLFGYGVYLLFCIMVYLFITRNLLFISYIKEVLPCLIFLLLLLFFVWPGIFKGDEYYTLEAVRSLDFSAAQTGITSLFYIACLIFFPSMGSISFFQILIISLIYGYLFYNLHQIYKNERLILLRLVFLLLPIVDACFFTLRATLTSWLFLLLMSALFFTCKRKCLSTLSLVTLSILCGFIFAWRSEYVYLLLFLPFLLWIFHKISWKQILLCVLVVLISFTVFQVPNKIANKGSNKYPISLVINPLGNIFAQDVIRGDSSYDDIMTINELIDVQMLRRQHSVRNISQYWNIPDILPEDQLHEFMAASARIIFNNFDHFLYYRLLTFAHTNGLYANEINHPSAPTPDTVYSLVYYGRDYKADYYFMHPLFGEKIRERIITALACRTYYPDDVKTNALYPIFYNCIPAILLLLASFIACVIKRKKELAWLIVTITVQLPIIFLTAPAMFFMYYLCFYLTGYFFTALTIKELVHS